MNEQNNNTALPESDITEWKSSWRDEYMKWMSAFEERKRHRSRFVNF